MATKVPIYLKRGSRKGKKEKLRDILSSDMISPPLGDFRHTIHIGSGGRGDTFGDISFLQGKLHLLPQPEGAAAFEFSRTATISAGGQAAAAPSPLLKNAISLPALGLSQALTLPAAPAPPKPPRLHLDEASAASPPCARGDNGEVGPWVSHEASAVSLPHPRGDNGKVGPWVSHEASATSPPHPRGDNGKVGPWVSQEASAASPPCARGDNGDAEPLGAHGTEPWVSHEASATSPPRPRGDNGEVEPLGPHGTEPWVSHEAEPLVSPEAEPSVSHAGSLLSLHVDLGPSILEDVLQVMDRHQAERGGAARPEILT